jgi:hypothetical protein
VGKVFFRPVLTIEAPLITRIAEGVTLPALLH